MSEDAENHTLRLLREIRETCDRTEAKVDQLTERVGVLETQTNGHSVQLSTIIGIISIYENRIDTLEDEVLKR